MGHVVSIWCTCGIPLSREAIEALTRELLIPGHPGSRALADAYGVSKRAIKLHARTCVVLSAEERAAVLAAARVRQDAILSARKGMARLAAGLPAFRWRSPRRRGAEGATFSRERP